MFLEDLQARPLNLAIDGLTPRGLHLGKGDLGLEIVVLESGGRPNAGKLVEAWKGRRGSRACPVLVVALHQDSASIAGPTGEDLPVHHDLDPYVVERLCKVALDLPDRHAALQFLANALPSLETAVPGLRNQGLFALHELTVDAPRQPDWMAAVQRGRSMIGAEGQQLLMQLGFAADRIDNLTQVLKAKDRRVALAILLDKSDVPEAATARYGNLSPVSYALHKADQQSLDWVVTVQGDRLRLYPAKGGKGVGRRGRAETYLELQTSLLSETHAGYLPLLFSSDALLPDGSVDKLLEASARFASELAKGLRDRIYTSVVPRLAEGVARARNLQRPTAEDLDLTYRMALTLLFRLLFIAYAEDRDLLPYRLSEQYRRASLKQLAQDLGAAWADRTPVGDGSGYWARVKLICDAIEKGDPRLSVPAYNGGLFTTDPQVSRAGATLDGITLADSVFEPALRDLLLAQEEGGLQPVDFRSLGVREFGTIYEGLLESELSVAEQDLAVDAQGNYIPARGSQPLVVRHGEVYLHNRSGARKSSGSYFTKSFAVEHLLDRALVPALNEHLNRVRALPEMDAAEAFFDFRVADIAMGSAHFLVAAIDRIEKAFTGYLAVPDAPGSAGIRRQLHDLKQAARASLGEIAADQMPFEDSQLLRRLIARRCIYGVDMNPMAVDLARLGIWIHTFVPGLPLSVLDHNLVLGNALVGVGTIQEIRDAIEAEGVGLFNVNADKLLSAAARPLQRMANSADATLAEVKQAREAMAEAKAAVAEAKALCDLVTARDLVEPDDRVQFEAIEDSWGRLEHLPETRAAREVLDGLRPFHFPVAFPEVFLRPRAGFDVLLGNPPWKEATLEDHAFWARHFPGLRGMAAAQMEQERERLRAARPDLQRLLEREMGTVAKFRRALTSGAYPGMGTGDPDTYKAFCWRFWNLTVAAGGYIGIVLPRSAFSAKGSEKFRLQMFEASSSVDICMVHNKAGWVFDEAEHRYTMAFAAITRGEPEGYAVTLRGPYSDMERYKVGIEGVGADYTVADILSWNDTASLPLLPTDASLSVFAQLRKAPRLDLNDGLSWRARPDGEMHATAQKPLMDQSGTTPEGYWPVFKGESFEHWNPDRGSDYYYAWADPGPALAWLQQKRSRARKGSAHAEFSRSWRADPRNLPPNRARIIFRDIARSTDTRTLIAALAPPRVFLTNKAPYLLWPRGDEQDQAYLLGVMSSRSLDWYARRFVEIGMNFYIFNPFPVPRPSREHPLWQRCVAIAGRLACPDDRFVDWAAAVGVEVGPLSTEEKKVMTDELDAVVAHLYGLTADQLSHIFESFHEGWDYAPRLAAVMRHYEAHSRAAAANRHLIPHLVD
ncbi:hypothetical protein EKN06_08315 [Croceicoccus ponticola]|uniref:site-specific DNA-methyltransferase (adenine-specific) n=1 Tax=Croceicoccus ponticola TaxID=2217664 RepID=A0A437GX21_9SPHN|nr:hypothetical protein [Croceicoccus ponticola]RVQ66943.1 hypothetical protein EKN06_08315 [Croceicoccus ponticola]